MAKGLFRDGNYAQVIFEGKASLPVRRDRYEHAQYQPPFNSLPTRADYESGDGLSARPDEHGSSETGQSSEKR